jgi:hypothetical protein
MDDKIPVGRENEEKQVTPNSEKEIIQNEDTAPQYAGDDKDFVPRRQSVASNAMNVVMNPLQVSFV